MTNFLTLNRFLLFSFLGIVSVTATACMPNDNRIYTTGGDYNTYDYPYAGNGNYGENYYDYGHTTVYTTPPNIVSVPPVVQRNTTVYIDDRDRYQGGRGRDWDRRDFRGDGGKDWDRRDRKDWDRNDRGGNWNRDTRNDDRPNRPNRDDRPHRDDRPNRGNSFHGHNGNDRPPQVSRPATPVRQPDRVVVTKEWDRDRPRPTPRTDNTIPRDRTTMTKEQQLQNYQNRIQQDAGGRKLTPAQAAMSRDFGSHEQNNRH